MKWLFLLLLSVPAYASQSLSAGSGSGTAGSGAPYNNVANWRVEFRLHGSWLYEETQQYIYSTTDYDLRIFNGFVNFTSWLDGSNTCGVVPPAGTDVLVRFQRTVAGLTASYTITQTGQEFTNLCPNSSTGTPTDASSGVTLGPLDAGDIAWVRTYISTVPITTPISNAICTATETDYELEGNMNDCSGFGLNLTPSGASYVTTPIYNPIVGFNPWPITNVFKAGSSLPIVNSSYDATENSTLSYFWQQLSGPAVGSFSSHTSSAPSFSVPIAGTYGVQVQGCNTSGLCASTTSVVSAVATDSNSVAVTGLSAIQDNLLGPLLIADAKANPWPYADLAEIGVGKNIGAVALTVPPGLGSALPGTVSFDSNTAGNIINTTSDLSTLLSTQSWVAVAWDSVDGVGTGRMLCPISSVNSTQIICQENSEEPAFAGWTAYMLPSTAAPLGLDFQAWTTENPSTVWNYYDVAIGLYRLYYRTGNAIFQSYARQFADIEWQWTLDHGYRSVSPRASTMVSQFFRALDGHPERFPGLYNWIAFQVPRWANPSYSPAIDNRESGYELWNIALGAKTDPDPTRHSQYCTWLTTYTYTWSRVQAADGSWPENAYVNNQSYVSAPKAFSAPFIYGGAPWREAINLKSMEAAYESLNDTSAQGCSSATVAGLALTAIQNAEAWVENYGRDNVDRGHFYEVNSQSSDQETVYRPGGFVSVNVGTTTLTGSGTAFNTKGYCDGLHFIGIETSYTVYKIASCASDTAITITPAFGLYGESSNVVSSSYSVAPSPSSVCNSSATYCFGSTGDRNLTRTGCGAMGWLYMATGSTTYKTWGDECYSATLGGPASGPDSNTGIGGFAATCVGPSCDGYIGDTIASAPNCSTGSPAPCTPGAYITGNLGKNFGETFGAPASDNEVAWRIGGHVAFSSAPINVAFKLSSVPNATQVMVSLTRPDGTVVSNTCSTSPCQVAGDKRQGNHLVQISYLSSGSAVLASGTQEVQETQ